MKFSIWALLPVVLLTVGTTLNLASAAPAPAPAPSPPPCNLTTTPCGYFMNQNIVNKFMRCSTTTTLCGKFQSSPTIFGRQSENSSATQFYLWSAPPLRCLTFSQDSSSSGQLTLPTCASVDQCALTSDQFGLTECAYGLILSWTDFTDLNFVNQDPCKNRTQIRVDPPWVNTTTSLNRQPCEYFPMNQWIWTPACCPSSLLPRGPIGGGDGGDVGGGGALP